MESNKRKNSDWENIYISARGVFRQNPRILPENWFHDQNTPKEDTHGGKQARILAETGDAVPIAAWAQRNSAGKQNCWNFMCWKRKLGMIRTHFPAGESTGASERSMTIPQQPESALLLRKPWLHIQNNYHSQTLKRLLADLEGCAMIPGFQHVRDIPSSRVSRTCHENRSTPFPSMLLKRWKKESLSGDMSMYSAIGTGQKPYWERNGFCLWRKRLEKISFRGRRRKRARHGLDWPWHLSGIDFFKAHQSIQYSAFIKVLLICTGRAYCWPYEVMFSSLPDNTVDWNASLRRYSLQMKL